MPLLKSRRSKIVAAAAIIAVVLIIVAFAYIGELLSSLANTSNNPALPSPSLSAYLNYQGLLFYNYGAYELPYLSIIYSTGNASRLYANASIYENPLPTHLYILNFTNNCFRCGNATAAVTALISGIRGYGMQGLYANTSYISSGNLTQMRNNSILVIVSGLIPSELEADNFSLMKNLLDRHTSIIYVGLNFSSMLISESGSTSGPSSGIPVFLKTDPTYASGSGAPFTFNSPTFKFRNGTSYRFTTYISHGNGSLVAFPNTLASWPSEQQAGSDIARAVWQMFWLPRYSFGSTSVAVPQGGSGSIGVVMNGTLIPYNLTVPSALNSGYLRVVLDASPAYAGKPHAYTYIEGQPALGTRGTVSLQPSVSPNESSVKITFNVTFKPVKAINLSTFVTYFYIQNFTSIPKLGGLEAVIHNFTGVRSSFFDYRNMNLGPGSYIIMLRNFSDNTEIAGGYFVIPRYNITLTSVNFTSGTFIFKISSGGKAINNIHYNISLNSLYPASGVVQSGIIVYRLPQGTPQINGLLNFSILMLGQKNSYAFAHNILPFTVNTEYIELGVVVVMILIMVFFVRAPTKDEFYIDVPNLPESKKVEIRLKASEVLSVFDKLNANYHWKYMPLSKTEVKSAIALNLKYSNIPIELTYRNIDSMLDALLVKKYIAEADELYAPISWVEASKHDIDYLATFKKLRIYFVTHSYTFTDIDVSEEADIVATLHGEKKYMMVYSKTSKFRDIPVYPGAKTYLVFINSDAMEDFTAKLYSVSSTSSEKLKMYISADYIRLVDADSIGKYIG